MAELIDPFERELRRRPRRNDGFSDDGLSYRVADDFGKMWGDALADYEARTGTGQRSVALTPADVQSGVISRMESARPTEQFFADNPRVAAPLSDPAQIESLRRELFDPLTQRFGSDRQTVSRTTPAPRTYKTGTATGGERIISVDPLTGRATEVFSTPARPTARVEKPIKIITATSLNSGNETISLEPSKLREVYDDLPDEVKNNPANVVLFKAHGIGPYAKVADAPVPAVIPGGRSIIGSELDNQFQMPPQSGTGSFGAAATNAPAVRQVGRFKIMPR